MEEQKPKKYVRHDDRVALSEDNIKRLDAWIEQVIANNKGVKLSRKALTNWLIEEHDTVLSAAELKRLEIKFYDDERLLTQALSALRAAKARGEVVDVRSFIGSSLKPKAGSSMSNGRQRVRKVTGKSLERSDETL